MPTPESRTPPPQPAIKTLPKFLRGSMPVWGTQQTMPVDAGAINSTVSTANSRGAQLPQVALLDAQDLIALEQEVAKMKALGEESGKHVDAFKKERSKFDQLLKATQGPVASAAREFSTAIGLLRAAVDGIPGALTGIQEKRDLFDKEVALASQVEEEEKVKQNQEIVNAAKEQAKGACEFGIEVIKAFLKEGPLGAAKAVGEQAAKGVQAAATAAVTDMGQALLYGMIKAYQPSIANAERELEAAKAKVEAIKKEASAKSVSAAAAALKKAGEDAKQKQTDMQEKAVDVSIKQKTLETALKNAGLPGMSAAMAARAQAQRQHTATFASLAKYDTSLKSTQSAGMETC